MLQTGGRGDHYPGTKEEEGPKPRAFIVGHFDRNQRFYPATSGGEHNVDFAAMRGSATTYLVIRRGSRLAQMVEREIQKARGIMAEVEGS